MGSPALQKQTLQKTIASTPSNQSPVDLERKIHPSTFQASATYINKLEEEFVLSFVRIVRIAISSGAFFYR
jgi:hypothetical protein